MGKCCYVFRYARWALWCSRETETDCTWRKSVKLQLFFARKFRVRPLRSLTIRSREAVSPKPARKQSIYRKIALEERLKIPKSRMNLFQKIFLGNLILTECDLLPAGRVARTSEKSSTPKKQFRLLSSTLKVCSFAFTKQHFLFAHHWLPQVEKRLELAWLVSEWVIESSVSIDILSRVQAPKYSSTYFKAVPQLAIFKTDIWRRFHFFHSISACADIKTLCSIWSKGALKELFAPQ